MATEFPLIKIDPIKFEEMKRQAEQYRLWQQKVEEFEEIKRQSEEYKMLKQNTEKFKEINNLKQELEKYKTKVNNITKPRVNKRNTEEMALMDDFFEKYLIRKNGASVKTVDVMTKANEILADKNIRFNKFEVVQFMKEKGISKKKSGGHNYYIGIKFIE